MLDWMKTAPTLAQDPVSGFDPYAVTVSETVEINAPAKVVWDVICDMPRYNEWNPF
ncbi:MAG: polyketide cyclase, partial [Alphaproteobacteria bacterium PA3]